MNAGAITLLTALFIFSSSLAKSQEKDSTELVKIETRVVLSAPPPMEGDGNEWNPYEYIRGFNGKEFITSVGVDSVSISNGVTELHTHQGNLFILIGKREMKRLTKWIDDDINRKFISVRGVVIPYKDKFAIKVEHLKQIAVLPME